jgi:Ion channel
MNDETPPAVVRYVSRALRFLQRITISGWYRQRVEERKDKAETSEEKKRKLGVDRRNWNDCYNVCWLVGVSIGFTVVCACLSTWPGVFQKLFWLLFAVGLYRLFEISINQLSVLFQTDKESGFKVDASDPRRLLAVALSNYAETIVLYALIYRQLSTDFGCNGVSPASWVGALYFSLVTTTTVGYGDIVPKTEFTAGLVSSHLVVGMLLTLFVLARFVGALVLGSNTEKSA